jgi:phage-related protein
VSWNILVFETQRGEKPVEEFIVSKSPQTKAKVAHLINLLEIHGNILSMPHSKQLSKGLYELRIRGKEEIRILYCFKGKDIYLLHGFKKQTQKTPGKEIDIALKRLEVLTQI